MFQIDNLCLPVYEIEKLVQCKSSQGKNTFEITESVFSIEIFYNYKLLNPFSWKLKLQIGYSSKQQTI